MTRLFTATAAILAGLTAASAQREPSPQSVPRFKTGVDLVLLDVSVLDERRMPVRGLEPDDFTVIEDGRPQKIQTFNPINAPDAQDETAPRAAWLREVGPDVQRNDDSPERRIVAIVLDDSTPMNAVEDPWVRRMANDVIAQLGPRDLASVVYTAEKTKGEEFTQDRRRLMASVSKFMGALPTGAGPTDDFDPAAMTGYHGVINTLTTLCHYLEELPQRRKTIVLVSVGLPIDWELAQPRQISLTDPGSATVPGLVFRLGLVRLQELLMSAQRANVNIYGARPRRATSTAGRRGTGPIGAHRQAGFRAESQPEEPRLPSERFTEHRRLCSR